MRFWKTNRPISFLRDALALGRLARRESFDLLHTHGSQDTWAAIAAKRLFRLAVPVLMTRHNTKPVRFNRVNRWLYSRGVNDVVVVSRASLETYRRFFEAGVLKAEELAVIHSCVDLDRFAGAGDPGKLRAELGVAPNAPLVGLIGRVSKDKGHEVLLEAIPEILKEFPDAVFVFAGKLGRHIGPKVRSVIQDKRLDGSIRLLGFREDIVAITAALDVSVLPAVGTDSSPAVLKEALLLGKPIVASRLAGLPEIVPEGQGILVTPGDAAELAQAIITVLHGRENDKRSPAQFPRQFTPEFMCEGYLAVYERMVGAGGKNARLAPEALRRS